MSGLLSRGPLRPWRSLAARPACLGQNVCLTWYASTWAAQNTVTLRQRVRSLHLRGTIKGSTFRLTLAAILRRPLALHVIEPQRLASESEHRLWDWMEQHLSVAVQPFADRDTLGRIEQALLDQLNPPLNIRGMETTTVRTRVSALRKQLMTVD